MDKITASDAREMTLKLRKKRESGRIFDEIRNSIEMGHSYVNFLCPLSEDEIQELRKLEYSVEYVEQKVPIKINFHRVSWY